MASPILANVFLHHVLDTWFEEQVKPRLRGQAFLVRYADDAVIACEEEDDARRVMEVLPKRFEKYGLTLHPTKSRLVPFRRPPRDGNGDWKAFDFLGFRHMPVRPTSVVRQIVGAVHGAINPAEGETRRYAALKRTVYGVVH